MPETPVRLRSLNDVPASSVGRLAGKRVFFGHQSVGGNILAGIAELQQADARLGLRLVTADAPASLEGPFFAHAKIGANGEPVGKTDAFAALLDGPLRGKVDVAFHKYCYVDITASTNDAALFDTYRRTMARLAADHPGVTFLHVTVPLVEVQAGPKAFVKKLLGRMPDHYADNIARERFNDRMRAEYAQRGLFDLAAIESTHDNGSRETIEFQGARSFALVPAYSADGAHLNPRGRRFVAGQLLAFLIAATGETAATATR